MADAMAQLTSYLFLEKSIFDQYEDGRQKDEMQDASTQFVRLASQMLTIRAGLSRVTFGNNAKKALYPGGAKGKRGSSHPNCPDYWQDIAFMGEVARLLSQLDTDGSEMFASDIVAYVRRGTGTTCSHTYVRVHVVADVPVSVCARRYSLLGRPVHRIRISVQ